MFALAEDRTGVVWMGTERGGVSRFDRIARGIARMDRLPDGRPAGLVKAFLEDRAGRLWFGGENGILRHDPASGATQRFAEAGSKGPNVNVLYEDTRGNVWAGTEGVGLRQLAPGGARFETIRSPVTRENYVYALLEDRTGALWVGTYGGLRRRDPATGAWTTFRANPSDPASLGDPWVISLLEDRAGTLWVGTGAGLDRFDAARGTFVHYRHAPTDTTTLSAGPIYGIHQARNGALWVVAEALNRLDPQTGRVVRFTSYNSPLLGRVLYGLAEDRAGSLWLNTPVGTVRFDPARRAWRRYETGPVVLPTDQAFSARLRTRAGRLFFGAQNGYLTFDPGALRDNPYPPAVVLTGLDVGEQPVRPGADSPLRVALPYADTVRLAHDDRLIRFTFAAMQFSDPAKNTYTYRLEGFDDRWHNVSHETWATFTNLPPGRYTFRVRAASADGVWSADAASVKVFVAPPWWATGWFRLLAALTFLGALYAAFRIRVRALAARTRALEVQVVRRTAEIEQQRAQLATQAEKLDDAGPDEDALLLQHQPRIPNPAHAHPGLPRRPVCRDARARDPAPPGAPPGGADPDAAALAPGRGVAGPDALAGKPAASPPHPRRPGRVRPARGGSLLVARRAAGPDSRRGGPAGAASV